MIRYNKIFKEKIYGRKAIVYHRTELYDTIKSIQKNGFKPGMGAMYGEGIYSTYELQSQLNINMESRYGFFIIKTFVDVSNYLIFDKEEAKKLYGKNYNIMDQLRLLNILSYGKQIFEPNDIDENKKYDLLMILNNKKYHKSGYIEYKDYSMRLTDLKGDIYHVKYDDLSALMIFEYSTNFNFPLEIFDWLDKKTATFTSEFALSFYKNFKPLLKLVKGLVFTGETDGKVTVTFNPNTLKPLSFALTFLGDFISFEYFKKNIEPKIDSMRRISFNSPIEKWRDQGKVSENKAWIKI